MKSWKLCFYFAKSLFWKEKKHSEYVVNVKMCLEIAE